MPNDARPPDNGPRLVYYCSGHGYGHATRVSAFTRHLLSLGPTGSRPKVHIVSSAPKHVFSDSIACGALYRSAHIDPVIVQPLAYRVDRQKSVDVLKAFLSQKVTLLEREVKWLEEIGANAVLSDAAFLGCLAAKAAGIPSILITNFSFDSVYSYLSTAILDAPASGSIQLHPERATGGLDALIPDTPIPWMDLQPLVEHICSGYRCADLLVLLPGYIPMPSFFEIPPLPASTWIDIETRRMHTQITESLSTELHGRSLLSPIPFTGSGFAIPRKVIPAPLLVRTPNKESPVYTPEGRKRFLESLGIPKDRHGSDTKILIVSFGGQHFHQPSRSGSGSRTHSRNTSREHLEAMFSKPTPLQDQIVNKILTPVSTPADGHSPSLDPRRAAGVPSPKGLAISSRLATESHIWVPGAPPAYKALGSPTVMTPRVLTPTFNTIPPTPTPGTETAYFNLEVEDYYDDVPRLLPDESWIAVVCGVSKDQWVNPGEDMPEGFYVAPKDVYMPDLTLIADVLLGKLGYGTVSECVDACTPFVYVSRPLFVEEHGLRLLLEKEGVGIELLRESYEAGDWATAIMEAYYKGKSKKEQKCSEMARGVNVDKRDQEGRELATTVVEWVKEWSVKLREAQSSSGLGGNKENSGEVG